MLGIATEWLHLCLGGRKCWAKTCKAIWVHCGLVVDHGLDDFHCKQLPGNLRQSMTRWAHPDGPVLDDRQLYRVSDGSMGGVLPRRHRQRQCKMASPHLGNIGRSPHSVGGHQLFATKDVLRYFQIWHCHHDVRLLTLRDLASNRSLEYIWLPLSQGCLYHDLYVPIGFAL